MRRFLTCRKGNFSVAFALSMLPVLGAAGMAIDYSRALNVRSFVQSQADIAAFSGAQLGPNGNDAAVLAYLRYATEQRFGTGAWIDSLSVKGVWTDDFDYKVSVNGDVPVTILAAVPGFPSSVSIGVASTVRVAEPRYVYKPPRVTELDNEAGDYNRLYVYCFDPTKVAAEGGNQDADPHDRDDDGDRGRNRGKKRDRNDRNGGHGDERDERVQAEGGEADAARTQMTAIADNAGTKYEYEMPRCEAGQMLSFRLMNVRLVRHDPSKWEAQNGVDRFDYYTDTQVTAGKEEYDLGGWNVLETVLCDRPEQCMKKSEGGIVPEGKDRTPAQAKQSCSPGKFMYYGWEDRPPGMSGPDKDWTDIAWTDRDYDDIRIVMACPDLEEVEKRAVRLVR